MSRIGNAPIEIPSGVEIKVENGLVTVKGPKGTLTQKVADYITVEVEDKIINVKRQTEEILTKLNMDFIDL